MKTSTNKKHIRLGDMLIEANKITHDQLNRALSEQKKKGEKIGKVLVEMGFIEEETLLKFLSWQLNVPVIDLSTVQIDKELIGLIPEDVLKKYKIMPVSKEFKVLSLAMVDPIDITVIDEVIRITRLEVEPIICTESDLDQTLNKIFSKSTLLKEAIQNLNEGELIKAKQEGLENISKIEKGNDTSEDKPVINFVNNLLIQANREAVSDIHLEPEEDIFRIRFRIDGVLHEVQSPPKKMELSIISRIKIMSKMDIAKTQIPQDGRFDMKIDGKELGFRVSSFPTHFGENIVIRILDKSTSNYGIEGLGLSEENEKILTSIIKKGCGFVLATGPTGSGKTTTLYALLKKINSIDKNIITIEDPIEYSIEMIRQSQINPKAGLTFGSGLRSILRQDPDVIMVGEIRDQETANIAIESSLTGHMVISTLHTNDAASAISRLIEMGNEPYLVASSLSAVIGQRLIRTICSKCKEPYTPSEELLENLGFTSIEKPILYESKGCDYCKNLGYKGRTIILEVLIMNDEIRELTMAKASSDVISKAAKKAGMITMKDDAFLKALKGIININEALSIIK